MSKKYKGDHVADSVYVEVITSPNCVHSPRALRIAKNIAKKRKNIVLMEVSIATNEGMERAKEFDVAATPTIAVNGRVAFVGVPSPEQLESIISEEIRKEKERTSYFF